MEILKTMPLQTRQKNLVIVIDGLNKGGAEFYLTSLLPYLCRDFSRVEILTLDTSLPLRNEVEKHGVRITQLSIPSLFLRFIFCSDIYYVHLARSSLVALWASYLLNLLRIPRSIVLHEHAAPHFHQNRTGIYNGIKDFVYRATFRASVSAGSVRLIVPTQGRLDDLKRKFPSLTEVYCIQNTLKDERFEALYSFRLTNKRLWTTGQEIRLCTFSRLHPGKQIVWAIEAVEATAIKLPNVRLRLLIAGLGDDFDALKNRIQKHKIENLSIELVGFKNRLEDIASNAHFFLLPSQNEGFGLGLLEAAIAGLNCIANDCPFGPRDIADQFRNVRLVNPPVKELFISTVVDEVTNFVQQTPPSTHPQNEWPRIGPQAKKISDALFILNH